MSRTHRRSLLGYSLSALLVADAAAVLALVLNQWFAQGAGRAWALAAAMAIPLFVPARRLSIAVLDMAERYAGIPDTGEKIPGAGQ
jgi:hypothetical protein